MPIQRLLASVKGRDLTCLQLAARAHQGELCAVTALAQHGVPVHLRDLRVWLTLSHCHHRLCGTALQSSPGARTGAAKPGLRAGAGAACGGRAGIA